MSGPKSSWSSLRHFCIIIGVFALFIFALLLIFMRKWWHTWYCTKCHTHTHIHLHTDKHTHTQIHKQDIYLPNRLLVLVWLILQLNSQFSLYCIGKISIRYVLQKELSLLSLRIWILSFYLNYTFYSCLRANKLNVSFARRKILILRRRRWNMTAQECFIGHLQELLKTVFW